MSILLFCYDCAEGCHSQMGCYCPVVYSQYVEYNENYYTGGQAFVCCQHLYITSLKLIKK